MRNGPSHSTGGLVERLLDELRHPDIGVFDPESRRWVFPTGVRVRIEQRLIPADGLSEFRCALNESLAANARRLELRLVERGVSAGECVVDTARNSENGNIRVERVPVDEALRNAISAVEADEYGLLVAVDRERCRQLLGYAPEAAALETLIERGAGIPLHVRWRPLAEHRCFRVERARSFDVELPGVDGALRVFRDGLENVSVAILRFRFVGLPHSEVRGFVLGPGERLACRPGIGRRDVVFDAGCTEEPLLEVRRESFDFALTPPRKVVFLAGGRSPRPLPILLGGGEGVGYRLDYLGAVAGRFRTEVPVGPLPPVGPRQVTAIMVTNARDESVWVALDQLSNVTLSDACARVPPGYLFRPPSDIHVGAFRFWFDSLPGIGEVVRVAREAFEPMSRTGILLPPDAVCLNVFTEHEVVELPPGGAAERGLRIAIDRGALDGAASSARVRLFSSRGSKARARRFAFDEPFVAAGHVIRVVPISR